MSRWISEVTRWRRLYRARTGKDGEGMSWQWSMRSIPSTHQMRTTFQKPQTLLFSLFSIAFYWVFLAVPRQLCCHSLTDSLSFLKKTTERLVTFETFDQSGEETWLDKKSMTNKKTKTKIRTITKTNTLREHLQGHFENSFKVKTKRLWDTHYISDNWEQQSQHFLSYLQFLRCLK